MKIYTIKDNASGKVIKVRSEDGTPPSEADIQLLMGQDTSTEDPLNNRQRANRQRAINRPDDGSRAGQAAVQGFGRGASFGLTDDIQAAVATGLQRLQLPEEARRSFKENLEEKRAFQRGLQEQHPVISGAAEFAGGITSASGIGGNALKAANTIGQTIKTGGKQGAGFGAVAGGGFSEGETAGEVIEDIFKGLGVGFSLGVALPAALAAPGGAARLLQSDGYRGALDVLGKSGVKSLTVGQATGSDKVRLIETSIGPLPLIGGGIMKKMRKSRLEYQKGLLELSGLDDGSRLINEKTLAKARMKLSDEYKTALSGKQVDIQNPTFLDDIARISDDFQELADFEKKAKVQSVIDGVLDKAETAKLKGISGEEYQRLRSKIGTLAFKEKDSTLSDMYRSIQRALDDQLERNFPNSGIVELNGKYANYASLQDVFKSRGAAEVVEGILPPSALSKEASKGRNTQAFKDLSRAGSIVFPDRMPNSATATRDMVLSIAGLGGAAFISPEISKEDAAKWALIGLTFSKALSSGSAFRGVPLKFATPGAAATVAPKLDPEKLTGDTSIGALPQ